MFNRKKKRGQSIVEMSLIFPFFLLIIVGGIVDFGFAFYNILALQQVANDAATNAVEKNLSDAQIQNYIAHYNTPPVSWNEANIYKVQIQTLRMTDGSRMKRIALEYNSKTYTPFYQTAMNAITGNKYIVLRTQATYKIPNTVRNRENF